MTQPTPADELAAETVALAEAVGRDRFAAYLDQYRATVRAAVLREAAEIGRHLSRDGYSAQEIANRLDRLADGSQP